MFLLVNIHLFCTELLSIMDEAKHLAEARKRMKMENAVNDEITEDKIPSFGQDKTAEDKNPSESKIPKRGENHVMEDKGAVAAGNGKWDGRKHRPSDEQDVEELHNLQAAKK